MNLNKEDILKHRTALVELWDKRPELFKITQTRDYHQMVLDYVQNTIDWLDEIEDHQDQIEASKTIFSFELDELKDFYDLGIGMGLERNHEIRNYLTTLRKMLTKYQTELKTLGRIVSTIS